MSGRYEKDMLVDSKTQEKLAELPEIITEYYFTLIGEGKSYRTAREYIGRVEGFVNYKYNKNCPEDFYTEITSGDINRYMAAIRTKVVKGKKTRTSDSYRATAWSSLKSFFDFLVPEYIDKNPVRYTNRPKVNDSPDVTFLTEEEINIVLSNAESMSMPRLKNRDLCILKLGFATGLRVSALMQIDIKDINLKENYIKVIEKGDKAFTVFIGEKVKEQIELWLKDRKKMVSDKSMKALFVSQEGNRLSVDRVAEMLERYSQGIDKKVTPHVMRHSCATNLYEKTGDIYLCASQLNHKNIATTQRYAEISTTKKREATNILDSLI